MSDQPVPSAPAQPDPAAAAPPAKKPGIFRRSSIVIILVLIALLILAFPVVIEPWLIGRIKAAIAQRNLRLNDDAKLDISLFRTRFTGDNVHLTEIVDGKPADEFFGASHVEAKLALIDSLASFDLVIDRLTAADATGNLRRRADGSVPVLTPPDAPKDGGWGKLNWWDYYKKASDYLKQKKEQKDKEEQERKQHPEQQPEPKAQPADDGWKKAKRYEPTPTPGPGGHHVPRVLVRTLSITGSKLGLPDQTAFDVTAFTIDGKDVALTQHPDETMTLKAHLQTTGAGPVDVDLTRKAGTDGTLSLKAPQLPVQTLSDPHIAGDALAKYGASGLANVDLSTAWKGWDLKGSLVNVVQGLKLAPQASAGGEAQQAAQVVNNLNGAPLTWPMQIGGQLFAPSITDTGVDKIVKGGLTDAVKGAAEQKAKDAAQQQIDKQLDKNPELKKGADEVKDKAKDLFKGFGK